MDNWKATNSNDHTKLDIKKTKLCSKIIKNNKVAHDRPAIFIEELKDQGNSNRSIKDH